MNYLIVGAGAFGREMASWIGSTEAGGVIGFLDDTPGIAERLPRWCPPVIGTIQNPPTDLAKYEVLISISNPQARANIAAYLAARGARFGSFVHPSVTVSPFSTVFAPGVFICPGVRVSCDARLGRHVHVNLNAIIGHDALIGDFTTVSPLVDILGNVTVGDRVYFGGSACVLPKMTIGDDAVVGASALVREDVLPGATVVGVPARPIVRR